VEESMSEFISWSTLGTYGGALAMTLIITQFTKDFAFTKKIPTQLWSYIIALVLIILANAFTIGLTLDVIVQSLLNAIIVSTSANGSHSAAKRVSGTMRNRLQNKG
jgi:hypothetical protein